MRPTSISVDITTDDAASAKEQMQGIDGVLRVTQLFAGREDREDRELFRLFVVDAYPARAAAVLAALRALPCVGHAEVAPERRLM